jgi:hypothetical protein
MTGDLDDKEVIVVYLVVIVVLFDIRQPNSTDCRIKCFGEHRLPSCWHQFYIVQQN